MHTEQQIKDAIASISELTDSQLEFNYKCCLGRQTTAEKKLYKPFITAALKELKKRNKTKEIPEPVEEDISNKIGDEY